MDCTECRRLAEQESYSWRSYLEQQHVNRLMSRRKTKDAKSGERDLLNSYNLACAERRLHIASAHPEQGHQATIADINIIIRKGNTRP
jgi:hypothetical protein